MIGTLLGKLLHMPRLGGCLPGLVLLVIMFGFPVSLALAGKHATAYVIEKREQVKVQPYTGDWYNSYGLVLHYKPPEAARSDFSSISAMTDSVTLNVGAGRALFDGVRVGSAVDVVYLPFRPSIAKLAQRSFLDLLREMWAVPGVPVGAALLLAVAVAVWLSTRHPTSTTGRALRGVVYVVCFVTVMTGMWMGYQNPESVPESALDTSGLARIASVRRIDVTLFSMSNSRHSSSPLAQPFDVIEVEFLSPRLKQVVHAADAIDAGSIRGLETGQLLRIRYDSRAPRTMRIEGGRRTFRDANARDIGEQILVGLAILLAIVALTVLLGKRNKRTARSSS